MRTKVILLLVLTFVISIIPASSVQAAADDAKGYTVLGGVNTPVTSITGKSAFVNCTTANGGDQSICEEHSTQPNSHCDLVSESSDFYMCQPMGEQFCFVDEDCKLLGKNKCVVKKGSNISFSGQFDTKDEAVTQTKTVGICSSTGGGAEDNAFGQAICNLMGVVTGTAGRAVVGVVVIVVGIMFFLGKVTWSLVLAIALGAGAMFGANAIVKLVTGEQIGCVR